MASIRSLFSVVFGLCLILTPGCFIIDTAITVKPDGSSEMRARIGTSTALLAMIGSGEGQEKDPLEEFMRSVAEAVPPGWTVQPFEDRDVRGVTVTGHTRPGESLVPEGDLRVEVVRRLFSTEYIIRGRLEPSELPVGPETSEPGASDADVRSVPEPGGEPRPGPVMPEAGEKRGEAERGPDEMTEGDAGTGAGDGEAAVGMDEAFRPEMLSQLAGALTPPRVRVTVQAPGTVVETNGTVTGEGAAEWSLLDKIVAGGQPSEAFELVVHTRLLNYSNIGRLADKLAQERGLLDMADRIAEAVRADLLPNPRREGKAWPGFDPEAYEHALRIIGALDASLGRSATQRIIGSLGLNGPGVTAEQLRQTWAALQELPPEQLVATAAEAVTARLRAPSE